jgi:hypothetical protein
VSTICTNTTDFSEEIDIILAGGVVRMRGTFGWKWFGVLKEDMSL